MADISEEKKTRVVAATLRADTRNKQQKREGRGLRVRICGADRWMLGVDDDGDDRRRRSNWSKMIS